MSVRRRRGDEIKGKVTKVDEAFVDVGEGPRYLVEVLTATDRPYPLHRIFREEPDRNFFQAHDGIPEAVLAVRHSLMENWRGRMAEGWRELAAPSAGAHELAWGPLYGGCAVLIRAHTAAHVQDFRSRAGAGVGIWKEVLPDEEVRWLTDDAGAAGRFRAEAELLLRVRARASVEDAPEFEVALSRLAPEERALAGYAARAGEGASPRALWSALRRQHRSLEPFRRPVSRDDTVEFRQEVQNELWRRARRALEREFVTTEIGHELHPVLLEGTRLGLLEVRDRLRGVASAAALSAVLTEVSAEITRLAGVQVDDDAPDAWEQLMALRARQSAYGDAMLLVGAGGLARPLAEATLSSRAPETWGVGPC